MSSELTPMMRQYLEIKEQHKDSILFFRLGDFYEMFFDDAKEATRILHITLTARGNKVPMCGIPYHAANNYIARLIKSGKKVAICEQVEEPCAEKKIVKREVVKIITPGTYMAEELLDESVNNYILSLEHNKGRYGVAYADLSTGEFRLTEVATQDELLSELYKISPTESLVSETFSQGDAFKQVSDINLGTVTVNEDWTFDYELSLKEITRHFNVKNLEGFGCEGLSLAVGAAGALLKYLKDTQKSELNNIDGLSAYQTSHYMVMDRNSHRNLELMQNMEDLSTSGTLFGVLDHTKTPMGKRRIKRWILNPLLDDSAINSRLDAVEYFFENTAPRTDVREALGEMYDVERLSNKISLGSANARDMASLSVSLQNVSTIKDALGGALPDLARDTLSDLDDFDDVVKWIGDAIVDSPPTTVKEGGMIREGYDKSVDELKFLVTHGKDWVANLQKQEIEKTGVSSLKVGYNKVFGYYIELTKANLDAVPDNYIRKQTLVNAERFITQELKEQESKIIGAEERLKKLEYEVFLALRDKIAGEIERLKNAANSLADLDALSNLAEAASLNRYTRPVVNQDSEMKIVDGRHPVLEKILKDKEFVPNDISMDPEDNRLYIITGSNMAGKSTLIRQVALITIMAQMGSFVPAKEAEIGVVDRIFTRVGASDRLYKGMSTFMVEMLETANILNNATNRSLIILDEIGRGTSTFDGVSIAWAVVEYIHHQLKGAKALFATHYHELTELCDMMPGVKNYHLAIQEWGEDIVFLYKFVEGSCDESFGIHVARLAGMPQTVVKRAREILDNLQKDSFAGNIRHRFMPQDSENQEKQLDLFETQYVEHPVIEKIRAIDANNMTPLQALSKLSEIRKEVDR